MPDNIVVHSWYLENIFNPGTHKETVDCIVEKVKKLKTIYDFDSIAFTGTSGSGVAFTVSYLTQVPLIHIRKSLGHSNHKYEGVYNAKKYLILDDCIETGNTIRRIIREIEKYYRADGYTTFVPEVVGILLYRQGPPRFNLEPSFKYKNRNLPLHFIR